MNEERLELKLIVEAILFASTEPLSLSQLQNLLNEAEKPDVKSLREILTDLAIDYENRPIELKEVASGYRFQVRSKYSTWVSRLFQEKPVRYSRAVLETLAIIAYRQPASRGDIEDIRGVSVSSSVIRILTERGWIETVGFKDTPGRPALFGTTPEFLNYFSLKSLSDLPPLKDFIDQSANSPHVAENMALDLNTLHETPCKVAI